MPEPGSLADLIPLEQVPDVLPRRRAGRKVHRSTVFRWASIGVEGVRLQTIRMGRTQVTRREWLERFFERIADARDEKRKQLSGNARDRLAKHYRSGSERRSPP